MKEIMLQIREQSDLPQCGTGCKYRLSGVHLASAFCIQVLPVGREQNPVLVGAREKCHLERITKHVSGICNYHVREYCEVR